MPAARHAVILVAGASTRTRPLTEHRPKPLIPLLGRPLLAHILDELVGLVERVTLVVGYRAEQIIATFGDTYRGMTLRYVHQTEINGTAGALLAAAPIDEPFYLLYGDNLIDRADVIGVGQYRYAVAGLPVADPRSFGILDVQDGLVYRIIEKPTDPPPDALANPGIYHFDEEVFPLLRQIIPSPRGELELTDLIALLSAHHPVACHVCTGHWIPVGTPWEALLAARFLLARMAQVRSEPYVAVNARVDAHAELEGAVVVGEGAVIDAQARIVGPTVIGQNAVIGPGALVIASAIESGATIGADAMIGGSVVGAKAMVGASAAISHSWLDDEAQVGHHAVLEASVTATQPAAVVNNLLTPADVRTRGAIIAARAVVAPQTVLPPESIVR
ncbi:MAG: nucleotidyltransferase [Chloroflexus sp.]|uniref:sugar phosphate nucleotidyltransferase n=1 Tax=Chloroflexus sp. TaxID=1904827 RepID=UPI0021DC8F0F|nr:sugar phosphate nucleotidyltransferase [Chloroflexus sp.]GIV88323.1 MAG: nucleotidyltransferase [Chloroflexus sp.]